MLPHPPPLKAASFTSSVQKGLSVVRKIVLLKTTRANWSAFWMVQFAAVFVIHSGNFPPVHCRCEELAGDVWLPAQQHNPRLPSTLALLCGAAVRAAGHPALRERTGRGAAAALPAKSEPIRAHGNVSYTILYPFVRFYCPSQPSGAHSHVQFSKEKVYGSPEYSWGKTKASCCGAEQANPGEISVHSVKSQSAGCKECMF